MRDHQRCGGHVHHTRKMQVFSIAIVGGLIVALTMAMLCSCERTARPPMIRQGGGQRIIPQEYVKMWHETMSEEQWLDLLHQRIHQPIAVWEGMGNGSISPSGSGLAFEGLVFLDSQSNVLEYQLEWHALMARQPLMFLSLLDDSDPETVLTGVAAYMHDLSRGETIAYELEEATKDRIAEAFRHELLAHRDMRIRWAAVYMLGMSRRLTPEDIKRGLDDESDDVRVITAFWLPVMMTRWRQGSNVDDLEGTTFMSPSAKESPTQHAPIVAATLLDHVNDNHFYVRQMTSLALWTIFKRRVHEFREMNVPQNRPKLPENFDWVRSDWQARCDAQNAWKQWWNAYGMAR